MTSTSLFNSLDEITSEYTVFEEDQIITEADLNSVSRYLDDQDRLGRINLTGAGVICGLRARLKNHVVTLTKGVGITTDGDLLRLPDDTRFDRYKPYDEQYPVYPPFYHGSNMLTAYELVETGAADLPAANLSGFEAATGKKFTNMVAVLLMESYIKDPDIQSAAQAAQSLRYISTERVNLGSQLDSDAKFAGQYRQVCTNMVVSIEAALPGLWSHCSFLLDKTFSSNPAPGWIAKLYRLNEDYELKDSGLQYFYDFLRDLIETWNAFRNRLSAEIAFCCPHLSDFPKHLLVGVLVPGTDEDAYRLGFYPASAVNRNNTLKHAVFLAEKIGRLIDSFEVPKNPAIRITPSFTADASLEDRAIPFYYRVKEGKVHERWNFENHLRGMDRFSFSYHAPDYQAEGEAADPLAFDISNNNFYRIEGHVGQSAGEALPQIENQIKSKNLPFTVIGLLLGKQLSSIVGNNGAGYSFLKQLHYLYRTDISYHLQDVSQFSGSLKTNLFNAVDAGDVTDDAPDNDGISIKKMATAKDNFIRQKTETVRSKLNQSYAEYQSDLSWRSDVNDILKTAGEYKQSLSKVAKTDFSTPFDGLITDTKPDKLKWLDVMIKQQDEQEDKKKRFEHFVKKYPGLEHTGGVVRGGTLVLLYNQTGIVVGDLMLSHYYQEQIEEDPPEAPLPRPDITRDWIVQSGVAIKPSREKYYKNKLGDFKTHVVEEWKREVEEYNRYAEVFNETIDMVSGGLRQPADVVDALKEERFKDEILNSHAGAAGFNIKRINVINERLKDEELPLEEKKLLDKVKKQVEEELAGNVEAVAEYVSVKNIDFAAGNDGQKALDTISTGMKTIKSADVLKNAETKLNLIRKDTANTGLAAGIGVLVGG